MPRLGIGIPLVATATEAPALSIQDFFWLNDISSELTPIHTASRTNLVPNTSANGMTGTGVTISSSIGPNGTNNGIKMTETSATSQHYKGFGGISVVAGLTYAISYFIKKGTYDSVAIFTNTAQINSSATINFANETITVSGSNLISNSKFIRNEGNGWYRVGYAAVADATGNTVLYTAVKSLVSYEGNTSNFTEFFGPQVEQDSRASAHIPTSGSAVTVATALNDTHDTWDYDSADLMLEEDPDSEGAWERGPNLITNHDFAVDANWTKNSGWTISGGTANKDSVDVNYLTQDFSGNGQCKITYTISSYVSGNVRLRVGTGFSTSVRTSNGTYTEYITKDSASFGFYGGGEFSIDNVTVEEYAITPLDV